jgi:hypothetical protein
VRKASLKEALRVMKKKSLYGFVDSVQKHDTPFDWALKQFPVDFHEPFYKNYVQNPVEDLFKQAGLRVLSRETAFFAKAVLAAKS